MQIIFSGQLYGELRGWRRINNIARYLVNEMWQLDATRANYIGLSHGRLSYLPAGRELRVMPDGTWSPTGRQIGKAARVVRMIIPKEAQEQFTDAAYEEFANLVKGTDFTKRTEFRLVEGEDVRDWYDGESYFYGSGSLDNSCMRHDHCRRYFDLYVENPGIVKMLCLIDREEQLLRGRALVWFVPGCDTPIMDRVYGNDATQTMFREYAEAQGWYSRAFNSYEREMVFIKGGETVYLDITVQLPNYRFPYYPYLDTLKHFAWTTGVISNNRMRRHDATLMNTHGGGAPMKWWHILNRDQKGESYVRVLTAREHTRIERHYGNPDGMVEMIEPEEEMYPALEEPVYSYDDPAPVPMVWTTVRRLEEFADMIGDADDEG